MKQKISLTKLIQLKLRGENEALDAERPGGSASDKLSARCEGFRRKMLRPGEARCRRVRPVACGQSRYEDFRVFLLGPGRGMGSIAELFTVIPLAVAK